MACYPRFFPMCIPRSVRHTSATSRFSSSIGTLFAFVLVSIGIWILRRAQPNLARPFRTPLVPLVPILGAIVCSIMILSLDGYTQLVALCWMLVGFVVYFLYGRGHSNLNAPEAELQDVPPTLVR